MFIPFILLLSPLEPSSAEVNSSGSQVLYVQVRTSQIRAEPRQFAKGLSPVAYGDVLQSLTAESGGSPGWFRVRTQQGKTGFIHESAVTERRVVLKGRSTATLLDSDSSDVVLAGKGFNPDVEREYKSRNQSLNYAAVDQIERRKISPAEVAAFAKTGRIPS